MPDAQVCIPQDICSHVGYLQGVVRQTGPLSPRAHEKDERSHPGHQQVRGGTGQNSPQGMYINKGHFTTILYLCMLD